MDYMEQYRYWLSAFADDKETAAELSALAGRDKEIEDRFYTGLTFGTGGMRGIIGAGENRMNIYTVRRATRGLADYILSRQPNIGDGVVIAYDSRRLSAAFAKETALVLCAQGIKAYLFDALRPVPLLSYTVRRLKAAAGVAITASHNPPEYNGYKVYGPDGVQLGIEDADAVTRCIQACEYTDAVPMDMETALSEGLLRIIGERDADDAYIRDIQSLVLKPDMLRENGNKLTLVYTPLHGAGNVLVRRALRKVGMTSVLVVPEQELPDSAFPTVKMPNPEDPRAFELAIGLAKTAGASVIIATDPDCDRVGAAVRDDTGQFQLLTGNQTGCLLLHYLLSARQSAGTLPANGAAVKSIVSSALADAICADFNVPIYNTMTGFKFIGEKIQQFEETSRHTFLFGFEESYGYLSGTFARDKDGVNAALLIAETAVDCMTKGLTLYDRLREIYRQYGYYVEKGISVQLPGKDGIERIHALMRSIRSNPPATFGHLHVKAVHDYLNIPEAADIPPTDMLFFELTGGNRVFIRPSGTEPKIKLYVHTTHRDEAEAYALNDNLAKAAGALVG